MYDIIAAVNSEDGLYRLEISLGGECKNPRLEECEPVGEMVCWHKRCNMGDETEIGWGSRERYDYAKEKELEFKNKDKGISVPIYLYDHSGQTMSTKPFSCKFDSGQVGIFLISKSDIISTWGEYTDENKSLALAYIESVIKTYDLYLRGAIYSAHCFYKEEIEDSFDSVLIEYDDFIKNYLPDNLPDKYIPLLPKLNFGEIEPIFKFSTNDKMADYAH